MEWWDHRGRGGHLDQQEKLDCLDLLVKLGQQDQLDHLAQEVRIKTNTIKSIILPSI